MRLRSNGCQDFPSPDNFHAFGVKTTRQGIIRLCARTLCRQRVEADSTGAAPWPRRMGDRRPKAEERLKPRALVRSGASEERRISFPRENGGFLPKASTPENRAPPFPAPGSLLFNNFFFRAPRFGAPLNLRNTLKPKEASEVAMG